MKISELKIIIEEIKALENFCVKRALEKLKAQEEDFGKYTRFESIEFNKEGAEITVIDSGYDGRDVVIVSLSLSEICMSKFEWNDSIKSIISAIEEKKREVRKNQFIIGNRVKTRKDFENEEGLIITGTVSGVGNNYIDIITDDRVYVSARKNHMEKIE